MIRSLVLIGFGGLIGSITRYLTTTFIQHYFSSVFPYGTLVVNISGCFIIGVIYALFERAQLMTPEWRLFLATGFCGGYTTFSTFTYEGIRLMQDGEFLRLGLYVAASVMLGFAATYAGMLIIKSI